MNKIKLEGQLIQKVGNELQNMSYNLIEALKAVNDNINDLRKKCGASCMKDKIYRDNNNNNMELFAQQNSALEEKLTI